MQDLASKLANESGDGYGLTNLKMTRKFYLTYGELVDFLKGHSPRGDEKYRTCVPFLTLKAAAGAFSDSQRVEDDDWGWIAVDTKHRLRPGMFVAQVAGKSMEPVIPDGACCLFAAPVTGTRQGKTVLVQLRDATDPETGGRYTVKRYESETSELGDSWRHAKITLKPNNSEYAPIEFTGMDEGQIQVVAEIVEVLGGA